MNLNPLLDAKTVKNYQNYLKSAGVPAATIDRKLSSLKKWQEFIKKNYLEKISTQIDKSGSEDIIFPASRPTAPTTNPLKNLYWRYSSSRISSYLHLAILVVFAAAMAIFGYNQIFKEALIGQAYPQAPNPTTPNRILSFQARLTDSSDTPITTATDMRFILYNDLTASGSARLWEELRYIDPDQDGLFSVTLGTETSIASSVFTENANLYLGVTVETDPEASPRQRIASVGYALNAETLRGFPPSASASADQIPVLTQEGDLVIAAASPQIYSSSGTFGIKGQVLSVTTDTGTNGSITVAPDGTGQLLLTGGTTTTNFLRITDANLSSGHLISAYVGNDTATGDLLNLSSGASETEVFTVGRTGATFIAGALDADGIVTLGDGGDAITVDGSSLILQTTGAGSDITINAVDQIILTDFTNGGAGCSALETDASGFLTCGSDGGGAGGSSNWRLASGSLSPINDTLDILVGNAASTSAKFAVLNINSGTPTASVSSGLSGTSAFLTAAGNLGTQNQLSLTLGGATSGDILIQPNSDTGDYFKFTSDATNLTIATTDGSNLTITPAGTLNLNSTGEMTLDSSTDIVLDADGADLIFKDAGTTIATFTNSATDLNLDIVGGDLTLVSGDNLNLTDAGDLIFGGTTSLAETTAANDSGAFLIGTFDEFGNSASANVQDVLDDLDAAITTVNSANFWSQSSGSLYPNNSSVDLLIGGQATTSAKFAVLNVNSGTPTATISANSGNNATFLTGLGNLGTTNGQSLTLGGATSGDILLQPNSDADDYIRIYSATNVPYIGTVGATNLVLNPDAGNVGFGGTTYFINTSGTGNLNALTLAGTLTLPSSNTLTGVSNFVQASAGFSVGGGTTYYLDTSGNLNANAGTFAGTLDANGIVTLGDGGEAMTLDGSSLILQTTGAGSDITINAVDQIILTDFTNGGAGCSALETDASGFLTCGSDGGGGGSSNWQESLGAISPINSTWDVLIGGTASTSAKFAFINVNSGTPTASIAGQITLAGGNRNIQTEAATSLILGGNTTGDILIQPSGDTGDYFRFISDGTNLTLATTDASNLTLNPAGTLQFYSSSNSLDSSGNLTLAGDLAVNGNTITSAADLELDATGGGVKIGTGTPLVLDMAGDDLFITDDLEILGGVATMSAATNSLTGKALNIQSTEFSTLNLGGSTTGTILLNPASNHFTQVQNNAGGAAALQIDQLGSGDVITASASGSTVFRLDTSGYAYYQRYADLASSSYYLDPASTGIALNIAGDAVIGGGEVLFTPISSPTTSSEGNTYYDSDTNHLFVYGDFGGSAAWHRLAMDMTKYSTTDAAVANQSYIEIAHNQNTNDLGITGWFYDTVTSLWKQITDKSSTIDHDLSNEFNPLFTQKQKVDEVKIAYNENNLGNGADGAATFSSDTNINTGTGVGRSCADAVNYSVTALTSTTATLEQNPSNPSCLAAGDEVLLINLRGTTSAFGNAGNYETLRISSISTNVVTFTAAKTKYYGDGTDSDDTNIGLGTGNQAVMLQRVPNYTNVTVSTANTDLTPNEWVVPGGSADANTETETSSDGEGGVLFFRATGTVSVATSTTINANSKGFIGNGTNQTGFSGGEGGEAYCGAGGASGENGTNGGNGASGGGGGYSTGNGGNGTCGGGGAGATAGTGSTSAGGAGGGGAGYVSGGGGAGYGTAGNGGEGTPDGSAGGTNQSGNGGTGANPGGGGGGGGTYGDPELTDLFFGSAGGEGAEHSNYGSGTTHYGGDGGGIVYIAANSISVSGVITATGETGGTAAIEASDYAGGGGGGSGGSIKLVGNTLTLGSSLVTAAGGSGGTGMYNGSANANYSGGTGGSGRIAVYYSSSISGTTSPTYDSNTLEYNTYAVYVGEEIETPGATAFTSINWTENLDTNGEIQVQTRSGNTSDSTDGSWEAWKPATATTNVLSLETANTHTNWTGSNLTVADGDITRNINYFEDEDEPTSGNITKLSSVGSPNGYAEATISSSDIDSYDYLTAWVYATSAGNVLKLGFGEAAGTEQEETITINQANTWQKVYWDISDVTATSRDAVTKLRLSLTQTNTTAYIDNVTADTYLSTAGGSTITSTANNYIQYRAVLTTTNTLNSPTISDIQIVYTNASGSVTIDADRVRTNGNVDYYTSSRLSITETALNDIKSNRAAIGQTQVSQLENIDPGTGADGAITVSSDTNINTTSLAAGRYCADGGDAVNYSVTALTSTTATLESAPSTGCLASGDEVLLINLRGAISAFGNVGNYETLRVNSISSTVVTFTTSKTKYYGDNVNDDTNIGLNDGNQTVMLQRVPNFTDVTITTSGTDYYPDEWISPTGSVNNGAGEGGVLFFRATGTVSIASGTKIHADSKGYIGNGTNHTGHSGGAGGEAYCGAAGAAGEDGTNGGNGASGGGGGYSTGNGGNGTCGGGGGGATAGTGSASAGGAGGGGAGYSAAGGGGGYGTAGGGGNGSPAGSAGSTNQSGNGGAGANPGGGGGGGGTYGDTDLTDLFFGSSGGEGAEHSNYGSGASVTGGDGGGIIYIAANNVTVSGGITSTGEDGGTATIEASDYAGGGGGASGGSIKIVGNTLSLGSNLVTAAGGTGGVGLSAGSASSALAGGDGGDGRIATYYANTISGSTSPSAESASVKNYPYTLFISDEVPTPNSTEYNKIKWLTDNDSYGMVQLQTRSGKTSNSTDGSWEAWKPVVADTNVKSLQTMNTHTDWGSESGTVPSSTNTISVNDGDITRDVNYFEDEDESTTTNTTKLMSSGFALDTSTNATLSSSLSAYWPLNETSGTRADAYDDNDLTANGTGGVGSGTGKVSNAADLELSENDFLEIADNADLSTGDIDFTLTAWVNMESESAGTTPETIVSKLDSATVREYVLWYTGTTDDRFEFRLYDSGGTLRCTATANTFGAVTTSTWYFIAASHDATANTCNISVNNSAVDSAAEGGVPADTAANFRIGANSTTETNFFDGLIDEVGFWKTKLSAAQITDLYNSGSANYYPASGQYAGATISSANLSTYDYVTAWVRASVAGNTVRLGIGESAATEQTEDIYIDSASVWQKIYWDITDIPFDQRDAITKLRVTNLNSGANNIYVDNITADTYLKTPSGSTISSTPNEYIQYRAVLTTSNTAYRPKLHNVQVEWNNGFKIQQTDANTVRLYNYTGNTQQLRLDAVVFGADLAEWYGTEDQTIEAGDVVAIGSSQDEYGVPRITKTNRYADARAMGIISTRAGQELGLPGENRRLVGLQGRVPTKIAPDSPAIVSGDYLTASGTYPGMATKLVTPGQSVAKALEPWNPEALVEKIDAFINLSYHDPFDASIAFNNVRLELIGQKLYALTSLAADITGKYTQAYIERFGAYSKLLVANLTAGLTRTNELETNFISPLASDSAIIIAGPVVIEPQSATDSGDIPLALEVRGDASISGELTAGSIKSSTIDSLRDKLEVLAANYQQQTATVAAEVDPAFQAWLTALEDNPATSSADYLAINSLEAQTGFFSEYLGVMGQANITNLAVSNTLDVSSLTSGTGAINFLAGLVTFDSSGLVTINGDLVVTGSILAKEVTAPRARFAELLAENIISTGSATFESVAANQAIFDSLIIAADASASADTASTSASITTNATAGKATLPAGATEYTIYTRHVSGDTLTYITPIGDTQNQVLYVKAKEAGAWFKVAINQPLPHDLQFNWWTIKLE